MYLGKVVEQASVNDIFFNPLHPYTRALLQSIPQLDHALARGDRTDRLQTIKGMVPDPYSRLSGCTFHPRCPAVIGGTCDRVEPGVVKVEEGHVVRCHLYSDA
jgi:peptide/nickel transport system ATP-binding protein